MTKERCVYTWTLTPAIDADLARIEDLRRLLDRATLPRRWEGRLRRELQAASTAASTSMEGVPVTVDEVRRILAGDQPSEVAESDRRLVEGYRDAMSYVLRRADDVGFAWQTELILGIHDRVMGGSYALGAGRFRTSQVFVADAAAGRELYRPPAPDSVPSLITELAVYAQEQSHRTPAAVLAAVVHVAIAGIHPFADGNGRTARVLASLAMYRGGYTRPEFTSLEEWWGSHRQDYYQAFACLGEAWNPGADVTEFVAAHVSAQRTQVEALSLSEATQRQLWTLLEDAITEDLGMPARLADVLYDAFFGRSVTNRYYRGLTDVSVATATNDLARLEASGLIRALGAGRSRAYTGSSALVELVARSGRLGEPPAGAPDEDRRAWVVARLAERLHDDAVGDRGAST
jgi:Fic family protein